VLDQEGDVVGVLAQRRQHQGDHRQAVVEILAEAAPLDLPGQRAVGGGHDAHVHHPGLVRAQPPHLAALQHAQQLRLQLEGQLADLVEEQGPAVGRLEGSLPIGHRAGEGAAHVAEELALDQGGGDGRAVEDDQRAARAGALVVQPLGHQLLAGAGLALDQHGGVGGRHPLEHREHPAHGHAAADEPAEALARRQRDLHHLGQHRQAQRALAEGDVRVGAGVGIAHREPVEEGAVAATGVEDADAILLEADGQVMAADRGVVELQVAVGRAADAHLGAGQLDLAASVRPAQHLDADLVRLQAHGRSVAGQPLSGAGRIGRSAGDHETSDLGSSKALSTGPPRCNRRTGCQHTLSTSFAVSIQLSGRARRGPEERR
jgi:hypothetical protein